MASDKGITMADIFNFLFGFCIICVSGIIIRKSIEAWYRHSNPEGYERMMENRERSRQAFLPYLIVGGLCMVFLPPFGSVLGPVIWLFGSIAGSLAKK